MFLWSQKCQQSFQLLKRFLSSAPILKITNLEKGFIVFIDTCIEGLGGVLMQDLYVVCCDLGKLKEHEKNCATHDLELLSIIHVLNIWDITYLEEYLS